MPAFRSGYNTDGEYRVLLPDGRKQIVSYNVADGYSGYVADVREVSFASTHSKLKSCLSLLLSVLICAIV